MAMPLPTPVEPSFSRCCNVSSTVRSLWPESSAALVASSCRICFLLLTFSAGMIALGATRSVSSMDLYPDGSLSREPRAQRGDVDRPGPRKAADHMDPVMPRQWRPLPYRPPLGREGNGGGMVGGSIQPM